MTTDEQPLDSFPRPNLAVDVALLTISNGKLHALVVERADEPGTFALPGGFVRPDENTQLAAARVLREKAGLNDLFVEQLFTFSDPRRDHRGWVVSVAHYALVPEIALATAALVADAQIVPVEVTWEGETGGPAFVRDQYGDVTPLAFDHAEILGMAVKRLRGKLDYAPVAFEMVPTEFSLSDLQTVYEAILGHALNTPAFRMKVTKAGSVMATGRKRASGNLAFRPPELFKFANPAAKAK